MRYKYDSDKQPILGEPRKRSGRRHIDGYINQSYFVDDTKESRQVARCTTAQDAELVTAALNFYDGYERSKTLYERSKTACATSAGNKL